MAQITYKGMDRNGQHTFSIRVSDGYGADGRQRKKSLTWTSPPGMGESKARKEAEKEAVRFGDAVKAGTVFDSRVKFEDFAARWLDEYAKIQLKTKTWTEYEKQLVRINQAIGHKKLKDIRTPHLNTFYKNLQEDGLNRHTGGKLSPSTVRIYHRLISSILGKAVKWGYIPYNPAANAELPKLERKEAAYLDEADARQLLRLLHKEPVLWRTLVTFDLLSGLRRGELLGLRWQDCDFDHETIRIVETVNYTTTHGIFTDKPKNHTSIRPIKLSRSAFALLREYKAYQDGQRIRLGDYWKGTGRVFTAEDGGHIHPDSLTRWFATFIKRSGLPKVSVHSLRHTYASLMIADGIPLVVVSRRLGHAQVSTTSNIYSHVIQDADEKAAQVSERFADDITPGPVKGKSGKHITLAS